MKSSNVLGRAVVVAALLLLVASAASFAQLQTGNLYGTVVDEQGNPLPGVTVTFSGGGAPQVQVTNAQGQFRFLGLSPGSYKLTAQLEGFSTLEYPNISIAVGRNTTIEATLQPAVEDVITVTAESPLLDERRISTGATVTETELEKIPTSRDPWTILQQVPGVLTDRINVGGNESGQQSQYVGPGSAGDQAVWAVDGVTITDMAALGSSPTYYDFDAFEEMQVTTGGTDATIATGGVVLNMVTKRGTNEWRGSGRYLIDKDSWQSSTSFEDGELARPGPWNGGATQPPFKAGNRIVQVEDYGAELGGPILRDRLWIWGSYGTQDVALLTVSDVSDTTELDTINAKINAQITPSNSGTFFYLRGEKIKIGRNAAPTRPQPTTWDQDGPTDVYKIEDTQIFNSNFYLTGLASYMKNVFNLVPEGGLTLNSTLTEDGATWADSFALYTTERPQRQYKLDGSNFFNTGSLSHELKYGAGYREAEVQSLSRWAGYGINLNYYIGSGYPFNVINLTRDAVPRVKTEYESVYAQDTLTVGNLTANFGLRYDVQGGENLPATVRANPAFPNLLPALSYPGADAGFEWKSLTPRLGLTWALGEQRKTLLRASYSQFADQLGSGTGNIPGAAGAASWVNPLYPQTYTYWYYDDRNGNGNAEPGEILIDQGFLFVNGSYNPQNPGSIVQTYAVDPNLDPPITNEVLMSVEHALRPEFVVGLNFTYRLITDVLEGERLVFDGDAFSAENINRIGRVNTRDDYVERTVSGTLPNGRQYTVPYYVLRDGITSRGGKLLVNGGREQEYTGASLTFNKRLANQWMLRGNFTFSNWEWKVDGSDLTDPTRTLGNGNYDGAAVLQGSGTSSGSKGNVYLNSEWSYSVNGLYQIAPESPWGFNVAANLTGRQGYPIPYWVRVSRAGIPGPLRDRSVEVVDVDEFRFDDIHLVDARVEKELTFANDLGLTVGVDVFNLFNEAHVLQRTVRQQTGGTDFVREITSPRIFRIGARFSFR